MDTITDLKSNDTILPIIKGNVLPKMNSSRVQTESVTTACPGVYYVVKNSNSAPETQNICIGTPLPNIIYDLTSSEGSLMPAVAQMFPGGNISISGPNGSSIYTLKIIGTPTTAGNWPYQVIVRDRCGTALTVSGTIIVPEVSATLISTSGSDNQTVCINVPAITPIVYSTIGVTGIGTATGLPPGIVANWGGNTLAVTGTPTAIGTYNYSIPLVGCIPATNVTGTITINSSPIVSAPSSSPVLPFTNSVNITHTTSNATAIGTPTGLPTGVNATWSANTITISGTPTVLGTFNYSIPVSNNSCGEAVVNATGTITVTPAITCESVKGSIKITQTPKATTPVVNYPFQFSATGHSTSSEACSETLFPLKIYAATSSFTINTQFFTNSDLKTPFVGNALWFKNQEHTYKIDSNGKITEINSCSASACQTRFLLEVTVNAEQNETIIFSYVRADGTPVSESFPASGGGTQYHQFPVGTCVVESSVGFDGNVSNSIFTWNDNTNCCPVSNSTEFLFTNAKSSASNVCALTTFNNKYYASSSSLGLGTQMYLDPDLHTPVGSGSMWQLLEDSGRAYKFDNDGKVAEISSCQTLPTTPVTSYFRSLGGNPPNPCAGWSDPQNPCELSAEGFEDPGYVTYYTNAEHTAQNTEMFQGARHHFNTVTPASCESLTHYGIISSTNVESCSPGGN